MRGAYRQIYSLLTRNNIYLAKYAPLRCRDTAAVVTDTAAVVTDTAAVVTDTAAFATDTAT